MVIHFFVVPWYCLLSTNKGYILEIGQEILLLLELSTCQEIKIVLFFFFYWIFCCLSTGCKDGWLAPGSKWREVSENMPGWIWSCSVVLGSDGKQFRTCSTKVVLLVDLFDEAKSRSKSELLQSLTENGKLDYFGTLSLSFRWIWSLFLFRQNCISSSDLC